MRDVIVKTEDLCKSFIIGKNGNNVLKNLNMEIYKGDFTVIMGSSGSGKSTLLYSLSTMDNPTSGRVELLGRDISKINEEKAAEIRNKDISFIFQGINLLPDLTIFENVTYAAIYNRKNKKDIIERANKLLNNEIWSAIVDHYTYIRTNGGGKWEEIWTLKVPQVFFTDITKEELLTAISNGHNSEKSLTEHFNTSLSTIRRRLREAKIKLFKYSSR